MRRLYFLRLFCFLLSFWGIHGQAYGISHKIDHFTKFRNITSLDGLSHNHIIDIKQDDHGFIWIATENGLNQYDGYNFKCFYHQEEDSFSLPDNYVTTIDFDTDGKMWVGTKEGLCSYDPSTELFNRFPVKSNKISGISNPYVRRIVADTFQQVLWVETVEGVLNRIDFKTGNIEYFKHPSVISTFYDYHELYRDNNGILWLGGREFGPLKFDEQKNSFIQLPVDNKNQEKKRDKDLACVFQDSEGLYWISATDGFYQYYPQSNLFQKNLNISTYDIIERDSSSLWLGSGSGLYLYHKTEQSFTNFRHNVYFDNSLVDNQINVLFKDKNDNLWIGTSKGISILYKTKTLFTHYTHIPGIPSTMPNNNVRTFLDVGNHKVWIGTHGGGVIEWNTKNNSFKTVNGTEGMHISTMYRDSNGDIWLGMWSGEGFLKYNQNGKHTRYAYDYESLKRDWYNDFFEDQQKRFYVGIWGARGMHFFNREKGVFEDYNLWLPAGHRHTRHNKIAVQGDYIWGHWQGTVAHRFDINKNQMGSWGVWDTTASVFYEWQDLHHYDSNITFKNVNSIIEDENQKTTYWCTDKGLFVFDKESFKPLFENQFTEVYSFAWLENHTFVVCTSEGIFLGNTKKNEISSLPVSKPDFFKKVFAIDERQVLLISKNNVLFYDTKAEKEVDWHLEDGVLEILPTTNHVLKGQNTIICTDHGLLIVYDDKSTYTLYNRNNSSNKGLISNHINSAITHSDTEFWLGTEEGLLLFNVANGSFSLVEPSQNTSIKAISSRKGVLWMATLQGMVRFNPEEKKYGIISYMNIKHKLSSHLTTFIEQDLHGNIWVGTSDEGVNVMDTSYSKVSWYKPEMTNPDAFWGENATAMVIDKKGVVYISSNAGINVYRHSDSTFFHITKSQGLPSDEVLGMEFDKNGFLWLVTPEALAVYNPENKQIRSFGREWGLIPFRFNGDIKRIENQMFIPSDRGFFSFQPGELLKYEIRNKPCITGLKVFADEKENDLLVSNKIVLSYDENFFTLYFSNFSFSESPTEYYYQLKGIDPQWVSTKQNYASYTNIKNGRYQFLLTTQANRNANESPQVISVSIMPPFWKTPWFILLEILFGFGIVYALYLQRIKQYKQREKFLITEQKLLRSQMNPHFIFNALTAIQSFIFRNEPKEAGRYLSKFAKLMRLFLQNTRQEFVLLRQELETIEHYMELQRLRFNGRFDYKITCDMNLDPDRIKLPPMMTQPFIENAIEHGFMDIHYKGNIAVCFQLTDNALEIKISDNGIGINHTKKQKNHKSLATLITKERLHNFSNKTKQYWMAITDLKEIKQTETGTEVFLRVPFEVNTDF